MIYSLKFIINYYYPRNKAYIEMEIFWYVRSVLGILASLNVAD